MIRYKIDYNRYGTDLPFALFCKVGWFKWEQIASFKTKHEAAAHAEKLQGLPIYIPTSWGSTT